MAITILNNTAGYPACYEPGLARPVTLIGRDLKTNEYMSAHKHEWGQVTYALEGVLRVTANNSSWIVPPQRAI